MKASLLPTGLLLLLTSTLATAQVLSTGSLPSCASNCAILQNANSQCGGSNSNSVSTWSCFCQAVYNNAAKNTAAICPTSCDATDDASVGTWFAQQCGSDNGASEHSGSGSGTTSSAGSTATGAGAGGSSSSTTNDGANGGGGCSGSWFHCHYQWIIMVIVLAIALLTLGFVGRWAKKRHDRKRDQIREGFNSGITSRGANNGFDNDKLAPPSNTRAGATDSPARTRDAFMPYGYGYSRGARGDSPEIEQGGRFGSAKGKLKGVFVREKSQPW